jgi:hypothetical protein
VSRPVFTGLPCAACLDVATAQLDLARHTQRASLRDSNSARRLPQIESSCSARHKGDRKSKKQKSKIKNQKSKIKNQKSKIKNQKSKIKLSILLLNQQLLVRPPANAVTA